MENTYWNGSGKHQEFARQLTDMLPNYGYTSNVFMNLFIAMTHVYYDAYNNGSCNIDDCYASDFEHFVSPYLPDIDLDDFRHECFSLMEEAMDKVFEYLKGKPLDFPVYTTWFNFKENAISHVEPHFEGAKEAGWNPVTFGMEDEQADWCNGLRDVSFEIEAKNREAKEHSLPLMCYSTLKSTGELIVIKQGEAGYFQTERNTPNADVNRQTAARLNKMIGLSDAQLKAMEFGSMFGWDKPGARPEVYLKKPLEAQISGAEQRREDGKGNTKQEHAPER